jgi:membrane-bound metal-dependent hydrolase YbcI (DUF457 family)
VALGALDEIAHFVTAILAIEAVAPNTTAEFKWSLLASSVAIDIDHIPSYVGTPCLDRGTPRPYPHSLVTLGILGGLAFRSTRHDKTAFGALVGTTLHLWRDLSPPGCGIPLLWPATKRPFAMRYRWYAASLIALGLKVDWPVVSEVGIEKPKT